MMVVEVTEVNKKFGVQEQLVCALSDVNFSVQKGEFLALAGSSGSGKTTLLNLIGGLDSPTEGTIKIEGNDISKLSDNDLANFRRVKLGFIFQSFNLLPVLTAVENVEYPLLGREDINPATRKKLAEAALEKVGLKNHLKRYPAHLSGGQRQRVAIARALVHSPSLIIADEPTANLDKKTGLDVLELMRNLNNQDKVTFIFSTHDPEIIKIAKRVISISDGAIIADEQKGLKK